MNTRHRLPAVALSVLLGLSALIAVAELTSATAWAQGADARAKAKEAYTKGRKLYDQGDYVAAIAEFKTADGLAPSGVNDFNIALAHEALGNRAEAVMFYRSYLTRVPDASNRATVEASIAKLESEMGADEQRAADEARAKAEADARAAEEARRAQEARKLPPPVGGGTTGVAPTGDPELDRVAAVDVTAIRDQRQVAPPAGGGAAAEQGGGPPPPPLAPTGEPRKSKPIYKQWWFWVVVGVSAYVLISIAAADSSSAQPGSNGIQRLPMPSPGTSTAAGATLWTF